MIKVLNKLKESWQWLTLLIAIFGGFIHAYQYFDDISETARKNQQMTLKNTIWNEKLPIEERLDACDIYLGLGYNSYTKKECEVIIEKGAHEGIFSYVERER